MNAPVSNHLSCVVLCFIIFKFYSLLLLCCLELIRPFLLYVVIRNVVISYLQCCFQLVSLAHCYVFRCNPIFSVDKDCLSLLLVIYLKIKVNIFINVFGYFNGCCLSTTNNASIRIGAYRNVIYIIYFISNKHNIFNVI